MSDHSTAMIFFILSLMLVGIPWLGFIAKRYLWFVIGLKVMVFLATVTFLFHSRSEPLVSFVPGLVVLFILPIVLGLKSS